MEGLPHPITISADVARAAVAKEALAWAVVSYGRGFVLPAVETCTGEAEAALKKLSRVGDLGRFGKLVFQHPFQA